MHLAEVRLTILKALRREPLDPYQLHADTGLAPFTIRAELKAMKRERLVLDHLTTRAVLWELTARGHAELNRRDQGSLEEALGDGRR